MTEKPKKSRVSFAPKSNALKQALLTLEGDVRPVSHTQNLHRLFLAAVPTPASPAAFASQLSPEGLKTQDIGRLVRERRKALGLSQDAIAARAGVGRRLVSELEGGKATAEIGKSLAVLQAVGVALIARVGDDR